MTARNWGYSVCWCLIGLFGSIASAADPNSATEPPVNYSLLAEPTYANALELTDAQRAEIAKILDERTEALAAKPEDRPKIEAEADLKLAALLSENQKARFQEQLVGSKLSFNFREQPWPDVLDWFARQANLALVMDTKPPGTFTYSDDKEHTATQAIDLLNSVLLSKGFALIRREKMLLVVDVSQGVPFELVPQIELEELPQRGRFELVTVEFPLGGRPVDACLTAVQGLIGKHGRVTPLAAAQKLLVTETAGKLRAVNLLITSIPVPEKPASPKPQPPPPPPEFASYAVKGLDVAATVSTLKDLFTNATVKPDPIAEEVHVFAPPPVQAAIKEALDKMLINSKGDNRPHLEIYAIDSNEFAQVQAQLSSAVPQAKITADPGQRRLLVIANETQQAEVRHTLEKLGVEVSSEKPTATFVIYKVANENTSMLTTLLQQAFPRIVVLSQPGRIAVRAWPQEQELVKKMIEDSEHFDSDAPKPITRTLKFYPVTDEQKKRFQAVLPDLQTEFTSLKVLFDAAPREIAIWANPHHHEAIASILAGLHGETDDRQLTLHRFPIRVAAPSRLLSLVTAKYPQTQVLLNEQQDALLVWEEDQRWDIMRPELEKIAEVLPTKEEKSLETIPISSTEAATILSTVKSLIPTVTANLDSTNRRLIVIGTPLEQEQVKELVAKLGRENEMNSSVLIGYSLKEAEAAVLAKMLQELRPDVRIGADVRANRILVTAPLAEQPRLRAMIEELDSESDTTHQEVIRKYPLKLINANTVVSLLQPLVPTMKLSPDPANKQILATGTELSQRKLSELLERIDGEDASTAEIRSYEIGNADANQVRNVLLQLVPSAVISATSGIPKMLIWASAPDHELIEQAIQQFLDLSPEQTRRLEIYQHDQKLPTSTLSIMQTVVPGVTVSMDSTGKQLIAWATGKQHEDLQKAFQQLTELQTKAGDRVLRTHPVRENVRAALRQYLPTLITGIEFVEVAGSNQNQLVCLASEADQVKIEEAIQQFERELKDPGDRVPQIYKLDKATPASATAVLNESLKNLTFLSPPTPTQLLILATADQHRRIEDILQQVEDVSKTPEVELKVYPVERARMAAHILLGALGPEVTTGAVIQVNPETNSLIIRADEKIHERLKKAIDELLAELPVPKITTEIYHVRRGSPSSAVSVLAPLLPQARLVPDERAGTFAANATEEDHERIRNVVDQMNSGEQNEQLETRLYKFHKIGTNAVVTAFQNLAPGAKITPDPSSNSVIVTATEADHASLHEAAEKLDGQFGSLVRVYPFKADHIKASTVLSLLDTELKNSVAIQVNESANSLIVRGDEQSQANFRQAVDTLVEQIPAFKEKVTQVYPLKNAQVDLVQRTIAPLLPNGTAVADAANSSLVVTAMEYDQERIREIIEKLDIEPTHQRVMKPYPIRHADAMNVYQTVQQGFSQNGEYSVTFQPATGTIFLLATPKNQEIFRKLIAELDQPAVVEQTRFAKSYALGNIAGPAAVSAIKALFQGRNVTVENDPRGNSVVVVADETQHQTVEATLQQLEGEEREFAVFHFLNTDLYVAQSAIRELFSDAGGTKSGPSLSTDYDSQKIYVRGTAKQLEQIRKLMVTLGEMPSDEAKARQTGDIRVIPFGGDTQAVVEQLRSIWPTMRKNRIEVIIPSKTELRGIHSDPTPEHKSEQSDELQENGEDESSSKAQRGAVRSSQPQLRLVGMQDSIRADRPKASSRSETEPAEIADADASEAQPPIVVLPQEGQITIMSPDHQALDQMEELLKALTQGRWNDRNNPNLSVFLLRNTGASEMQRLFKQLSDDQRFGHGEFHELTVAADERLNALIVQGSRKSREIVQELLEVLDTKEVPESLLSQAPTLIPLINVEASRVMSILESVYKNQLTSGGGRKEVQIPKGVSSDVASVLQQINAAAAGPVLTLEVDEASNTIIMRAPSELSREVKEFVAKLDQHASETSHRKVRIIRLHQNKSDQMEKALQEFLLQDSPSTPRRRSRR